MKNTLKITLAIALALFLLTGCGFTRTNADASGEAVVTAGAATLSVEVDAAVSDRDAAGEYDAAEAEQRKATELMIVAQAELQAEVAVGPSHRLAFLLDVGSHLVKGHLQQALQTLSRRGAIFQYVGLNLTMSRRIDGLG